MAPPKAGAGSQGDKNLQSKSPAQFFADNKNIAGFDNVRLSCSLQPPASESSTDSCAAPRSRASRCTPQFASLWRTRSTRRRTSASSRRLSSPCKHKPHPPAPSNPLAMHAVLMHRGGGGG
jgi:hypothetical protein